MLIRIYSTNSKVASSKIQCHGYLSKTIVTPWSPLIIFARILINNDVFTIFLLGFAISYSSYLMSSISSAEGCLNDSILIISKDIAGSINQNIPLALFVEKVLEFGCRIFSFWVNIQKHLGVGADEVLCLLERMIWVSIF